MRKAPKENIPAAKSIKVGYILKRARQKTHFWIPVSHEQLQGISAVRGRF